MEHEGSLPHLQVPATCACLKPDQSSPCPQTCRPILHICYFIQANLQGVYFIAAQDTPALSHRTLISVGTSCDCFGGQDSSTLTLRLRMRGAFIYFYSPPYVF
jgi:hypothetical protein